LTQENPSGKRLTAEEAEDFTQALGSVLTGGYRFIFQGWRLGVPDALNMSVQEWVDKRLGGYIKMAERDRQKAIAEMQAEQERDSKKRMSTRELAGVLGVSHATVATDQKAVKNLTGEGAEPSRDVATGDDSVKNLTGEPAARDRIEVEGARLATDGPPPPIPQTNDDRQAGGSNEPLSARDQIEAEKARLVSDEPPPATPQTEEQQSTAARRDRDKDAEAKRMDRDRREEAVEIVPAPIIREGKLNQALADVSDLDLVLTDPPYPREFLPAWSELALWAAAALKPGAWLVAYSGQYHLPEVIQRLSAHLEYQWLGWIHTPGPNVAVQQKPIQSGGKPLLLFSNGKLRKPFNARPFMDIARADGRTRILHEWEQDQAPIAYYMDALTERGEYVADPFLGSGTTALVAKILERRFIGCDVNPEAVQTTRTRIGA
jgi:DNA methylase